MNISNSKYHKVWKVYEQNGIKKVDLGDSKKDKNGKYENWTWFGSALFGNAKHVDIQKDDIVEIISGSISQSKYKDKWLNNVAIFEVEVMKKGQLKKDSFDNNEIPF